MCSAPRVGVAHQEVDPAVGAEVRIQRVLAGVHVRDRTGSVRQSRPARCSTRPWQVGAKRGVVGPVKPSSTASSRLDVVVVTQEALVEREVGLAAADADARRSPAPDRVAGRVLGRRRPCAARSRSARVRARRGARRSAASTATARCHPRTASATLTAGADGSVVPSNTIGVSLMRRRRRRRSPPDRAASAPWPPLSESNWLLTTK